MKTLALLKQLFNKDSDLDDRHFTTLHRIVLGLDNSDLQTYLQTCLPTETDHSDSSGFGALHWAARRHDPESVKLLLERGADPNLASTRSHSALHFAASVGDLASINYLLSHGAKIDAPAFLSLTPLNYMCSHIQPRALYLTCLQRLINAGANVNTQSSFNATPLHYASQYGHTPTLELLLRNGAEIDKPMCNGETPLTVAIQTNRHDIPPILLAHGANLAHHTMSGRSLLHEAAEYGDEKTLRILTSLRMRGVQIERQSSDGNTARDLARKRTDVTGEWRIAFADLLASVDESVDESVPEPPQTRPMFASKLNFLRIRLSDIMKIIEDICYEVMLGIYRCATWLLRLRVPIFSALVVFLAITWYVLRRP